MRAARPFHPAVRGGKAEQRPAMHAAEAHARHDLRVLFDQLDDFAAVVGESAMDRVDIGGEGLASPKLRAERAAERHPFADDLRKPRQVAAVPHLLIEATDRRRLRRIVHASSIASSSVMMFSTTARPMCQKPGSLASRPNGARSSLCRLLPPAFSMARYFP